MHFGKFKEALDRINIRLFSILLSLSAAPADIIKVSKCHDKIGV